MEDKTIKLTAVGDVMLGDFPLTLGFGVRSMIQRNASGCIFDEIKPIFQKSDLCFGNLECVLSDYGLIKRDLKSNQMRASPYFTDILGEAGFNVMSIANNHAMQHGPEAFTETKDRLVQKNIVPVGLACENGKVLPKIVELKDMRICFLGYSLRPEKYSLTALYARGGPDEILQDICENKVKSDVVIVSLHWGDEFVDAPSPQQVNLAHSFVDAGATIVLGHHPHVLQGIEKYRNALIAYSLGNFVFDFWQDKMKESIILQCEVSKEGLSSFNIVPVYINSLYQPTLLKGVKASALIKKVNSLSEIISLIKTNDLNEQKKYDRNVKKKEIINQVQNRLFFFRNFLRYERWIRNQSLKNFLMARIKNR